MEIVEGGLDDDAVAAFLAAHLAQMHQTSPAESVHALDLAGLRRPGTRFWTAWDDGEVVGTAALKLLPPDGPHGPDGPEGAEGAADGGHAELKSMRTAPHRTRQGIAGRLLAHVLDAAARDGVRRVSLETGSQPFFAPAVALYVRHGFEPCAPFADYRPDPNSVFLTRELDPTLDPKLDTALNPR